MKIKLFFKDGSIKVIEDVVSVDYGKYSKDLYIFCKSKEKDSVIVISKEEDENIQRIIITQEIFRI